MVADDDGVCIVGSEEVVSVLENAQTFEANEGAKRASFEGGKLGLDIYNMRACLVEKGLKYV